MHQGLLTHGEYVVRKYEDEYRGLEDGYAVFYGYDGLLPQVMRDYAAVGRAAYIDLGYWQRLSGGKLAGYHKIVWNGRHPEKYWRKNYPTDRLDALGVKISDWQPSGRHIVLAGMGDKAAAVYGLAVEAWERAIIQEIRRHTTRPIVYRPKPSWKQARPIVSVDYAAPAVPIENVLTGAHCVVTHHSNVAVDALVAGVPAFTWHGVAREMALQDLTQIEKPIRPENRQQWAADVAYLQWTVDEMAAGAPWSHFRAEGLVR